MTLTVTAINPLSTTNKTNKQQQMEKSELRAIVLIANKLGWNGKPATMVLETIRDMVVCKQCDDLCATGDRDDFEDTLCSIALYTPNKLWDLKHEAREFKYALQSIGEYEPLF